MATGTTMDSLLSPSQPRGTDAIFVAERIDSYPVNNHNNTEYVNLANIPILPSEVTNACSPEISLFVISIRQRAIMIMMMR